MLWLGPPCALHALSPGALPPLQAACRSLARGETARCNLPGARALVGLLCGHGEASPVGKEALPAPRKSRRLLRPAAERPCPWFERRAPSHAVRFCLPAGAGPAFEPIGRESQLLWRLLHRRQPPAADDPRWLHADASRRATGGGESRSLGSRKDTVGSPGNDHTDPSQKPNKSQQLKKVFKEYGGVAVAFHVGISLMSLGMFYLAVSSGVDMTAILFKLGFDEAVVQSKLAAGTSTFLLAYAIHKLFAPVRISITLISVPLLVRYFRKIGFFKPPSPNP
uniref:Protein FAM210B, mitochondrial n=1 Tax=Pogona vitticeps TaxID=103695 RepID=A0ABM5G5K1_9SAUR